MTYSEMKPCPALATYVNCFWYIESEPQVQYYDCTFPDGCLELIFNIGTEVYRSADNQVFTKNPQAELIGQMTAPYFVQFKGMNRILGIRFFPHTFSCFTKVPLSELTDQTLDADLLLGKDFRKVADIVFQEENILRSIALLEQFLLEKILPAVPDLKFDVVSFAVKKILLHTTHESIDTILRQTSVNARYLQRLFLQRIGISPRMLLKTIRFQKTFQYLKVGTPSLTDVAYEVGYFDQAHFIRDFKFFTGITPSAYLSKEFPINQYFLSEESTAYLYNYLNH